MAVEPIILSHKRAGDVTTHRFVSGCRICIPESQAEQYRKAHPTLEQLVHPDTVVGIWAKREWVLRTVQADHVQMDDDVIGLYRVYRPEGSWKKSVVGPDRAYELIQATADRARKLGAYLFGWGQHARPLTYNALKPFRFGGYTPSGALGLLEGSKLWWPDGKELGDGDDYWACLLNAHLHRYCFYDRRFTFAFRPTLGNAGGLTEFRSGDTTRELVEHRVLEFLQKNFGQDVIVRNAPETVEKGKTPGRRQIVLPWTH